MKGVNLFLADGFEEIEALATVDILRRGGVDVKMVSIMGSLRVTGAHGIVVTADLSFADLAAGPAGETGPADAMIFPGGMPGAAHLASDKELIDRMIEHDKAGGVVAAICAAPGLVVSQLPDLAGRRFTCYDGFEEAPSARGAEYVQAPAVVCGNLVTGRGPAFAIDFALAVLEVIAGEGAAAAVRKGMLL